MEVFTKLSGLSLGLEGGLPASLTSSRCLLGIRGFLGRVMQTKALFNRQTDFC